MSRHKVIRLITKKASCVHHYIYITPILFLRVLCSVYVMDQFQPSVSLSLNSLLSTFRFIGTAMCNHSSCDNHSAWIGTKPFWITWEAHFLHDYMYVTPILQLWDFSTIYVVDHLWPFILHSLISSFSTLWVIGNSNT